MLDCDDIMAPQRIEKSVSFMLKNPKADILGGNMLMIDENANYLSDYGAKNFNKEELKLRMLFQNWIGYSSVCVRMRPEISSLINFQ